MNTPAPESVFIKPLEPGLYIVATPIGNLGDITMRGVDVLRRAQIIACEDTRVTGKLLKAIGAETRMQRYDDHATVETRQWLIEQSRQAPVALVSDAGTPLISDPGYRLVRAAREAGVNVAVVPGACAAIAGLTLSGLPNDRFLFAGFLPVKDKARADMLGSLDGVDATLIFYETGPRLVRSLSVMADIWPKREIAVARELTKLHEECRSGLAAELAEYYTAHPPKGEIVLLVGPPAEQVTAHDSDALLREALEEMSASKAAGTVARLTGMDRQTLYARAVELKSQ
ncbi:16S rRNA (cytidine(1402)-2'-O)-methyltransferase [Qipengyuania sp. ASV99]|uniref:16S rRNA (cytidine(1402)-2'-O)-methyltransferase n=1 Tax=Qipengyuania sp. ASV99 TaxID=3399681 RepID=UPI003A4C6205